MARTRAGPLEIGRSTASASPRVRPAVFAYPDIAPLRSLIRIRSTADFIWKEIDVLAQVMLKPYSGLLLFAEGGHT